MVHREAALRAPAAIPAPENPMFMELTMSREDDIMDAVLAQEKRAVANSNNNDPAYVAERFFELYGNRKWPVPVASQLRDKIRGRLFYTGKPVQGSHRGGINVKCRDDGDDSVAEYLVEIDGHNGVVATIRYVN